MAELNNNQEIESSRGLVIGAKAVVGLLVGGTSGKEHIVSKSQPSTVSLK